jgi:glutathione S-transferase
VSKAKLYFSRNYNPRLAVAAARYLNAPVEFEFASPFSPAQSEKFLKLNPNQSVPILVEGDRTLWEADAIACRLSQLANSDFWPMGDSLPDVIRWISWGYWNFRQGLRSGPFWALTHFR